MTAYSGIWHNGVVLDTAQDAITQGDLIVIPTDTVYGIAADPFSSTAVDRLLVAKGRSLTMPPPILVADMEQALSVAQVPGSLQALWPGAVTVIVKPIKKLGWEAETVAIRVPDLQSTRSLLDETGPLAVTSANITGMPPATTIEMAQEYFGDSVAVYIDGGESPLGLASTIVDLTGVTPTLVRRGAVEWDDVMAALN